MDRETQSDESEKPAAAGDKQPRAYSEFIETARLTPEEETARKRRNLAIALGLVTFIVLIFLVTVVRMTSNYSAGAAG